MDAASVIAPGFDGGGTAASSPLTSAQSSSGERQSLDHDDVGAAWRQPLDDDGVASIRRQSLDHDVGAAWRQLLDDVRVASFRRQPLDDDEVGAARRDRCIEIGELGVAAIDRGGDAELVAQSISNRRGGQARAGHRVVTR